MGAYVNPTDTDKVTWLFINGEEVSDPYLAINAGKVHNDEKLVCLVDNGAFFAAAIAFDDNELKVFADKDDDRPKRWFIVKTDLLYKVSPELQFYLNKGVIK